MKELAESVNQLGNSFNQFQAKTDGAISDLTKQMSQFATLMSALTNEPGRSPSQTIQNPKGNVNAVTLRSGRKLVAKPMEQEEDKRPENIKTLEQDAAEEEQDADVEEGNVPERHRPGSVLTASLVPALEEHKERPVPRTETTKISAALPFQVPARAQKQHVMDEDVFELFSKVEINIPLLEAIKQIPRYAKFLKELCTNRRRSIRYDQELMSRNVSAVIQRKVPPNAEIRELTPYHAQSATSGSRTAC
ncbi:unnamed protein product [Rhodiola kirilowii]